MKRKLGIFLIGSMLLGTCGCDRAEGQQETKVIVQSSEESKEKEVESQSETSTEESGVEESSSEETSTEESNTEIISGSESAEDPESLEGDDEVTLIHPVLKHYGFSVSEEKTYSLLRSQDFDQVFLDEEKNKFPKLAKTLESESEAAYDRNSALVFEGKDDIKEWRETMEDTNLRFYEDVSSNIVRSDSRVLSIRHDYDGYVGGAHGYYSRNGLNYDTESGNLLLLTDLITDKEKLAQVLIDKVNEKYADDLLVNNIGEYITEAVKRESLCYIVGYESMTFYFNPYEIASFAAGILTVDISYKENPDLFNIYYTLTPNSYIIAGDTVTTNYIDFDGDSKVDEIEINETPGKYCEVESMEIIINNESTVINDVYAFSVEPYFVKTEGGTTYLYLFYHVENDYIYLEVFDMSKKEVVSESENLHLSGSYGYSEGEKGLYSRYEYRNGLVDPANMVFTSRLQFLGTADAHRTYHVGQDGVPISEDEPFVITSSHYTFVAVQNVAAKEVNEDGEEIGEIAIRKDDEVRFYRTDNSTYADLILENGKIARVAVDASDWPITIDGTDCTELFEGIVYAG